MSKTATEAPPTSAEAELAQLEQELADKQASLAQAVQDANADGVLVLRESIAELGTRIGFARVLAAREALAAVEAELNPFPKIDITTALASADKKRVEAQRLVAEAEAEVTEALEASRDPQRWQQDHSTRLVAARQRLAQAEAAARGAQPAPAATQGRVSDGMAEHSGVRELFAGRQT